MKMTKKMIEARAKELIAEDRNRYPNAELNRSRYYLIARYQLLEENAE